MARIRTIKPEFFRHEALFEAEQHYQLPLRLAFAGLFTCCDREGRFRWRPRQLKLDILPYDGIDFAHVLDALVTRGFVVKYKVKNEVYGYIPSWHKHQHINNKEMLSDLPIPDENNIFSVNTADSPVKNTALNKGFVTCESGVLGALATPDNDRSECLQNFEGEVEGNMERKGNGMDSCTEPLRDSMPSAIIAPSTPYAEIIQIPLNNKTEFPITQAQIDEWQSLYPAVDVLQALRNIRGWNLSNPQRRKTKTGILKHITNWLAKEQNKAGCVTSGIPPPESRSSMIQAHNQNVTEQWLNQNKGTVFEGEINHVV